MKSGIRVIKDVIRSPIGPVYISCLEQLFNSDFFEKLNYKLFPCKDGIISDEVWKIWLRFARNNSDVTYEIINTELLKAYQQKEFTELTQNYKDEFRSFIEIIISFVHTARIRQVALEYCNLFDWLRLQWHIFKRYIKELIGKQDDFNSIRQADEDQSVYCSRVVRKYGLDKKKKNA